MTGIDDSADEPPVPVKLDRNEALEYTRIIRMLDYRQNLNLSAHLYSAFLLSKRKRKNTPGKRSSRQIPHDKWTSWPLRDAPPPPQIFDDLPNDEPVEVNETYIEALRESSKETFPILPSSDGEPSAVLLRSCEEVLQRIVYKKIHDDTRGGFALEPLVEPEPTLDEPMANNVMSIIEKHVQNLPLANTKRSQPIGWQQLSLSNAAKQRLKRLFDREVNPDLSDSDVETTDTVSGTVEDDEDEDEDEEEDDEDEDGNQESGETRNQK